MVNLSLANAGQDCRSAPKGFDDYELTLGDIMRGERATLGKSLLDVQRELRIKASYISAIENCDSGAFDTPGFIAGYVRSYAKYLGMHPEEVYQKFCAESGYKTAHGMSEAASVRPTDAMSSILMDASSHHRDSLFINSATAFLPPEQSFFEKIEARAIGSMAILMTLIVGIGYGGWSVLNEIQRVNVTPADVTPFALSDLDPVNGFQNQNSGNEVFNQKNATLNDRLDRLYRPQALEVPVLVAREAPISTLDSTLYGNFKPETLVIDTNIDPRLAEAALLHAFSGADETITQSVAQVLENAPAQIALFATREAWVSIKSADGTRIFENIMRPGQEFILPMTELPPQLHTGMSGSVYFAVNGQLYGPAGTGTRVVKNIILSQKGLQDAYNLANIDEDPQLLRVASTSEVSTFTITGVSD
jgi:hypothetical protein